MRQSVYIWRMNKNETSPTAKAIATFVLEEFIKTGTECFTVKEIAAGTTIREGAIRRAINADFGAVPGTTFTTKAIPVIERNYRSKVCDRTVAAYAPTRRALREHVLSLRAQLSQARESSEIAHLALSKCPR